MWPHPPPSSPLLTINPTSPSAMPIVNSTRLIAVPGPSSESTQTSPSPPPPTSAKRRRQATVTDTHTAPSTGTGPIRNTRRDKDVPKKKKAARACFHCQKAHLTCDDCTYRLTLTLLTYLRRFFNHMIASPSLPALYKARHGRLVR